MRIYGNSINMKKNLELLKKVMDDMNLHIHNCIWESMKGDTWFSGNSEFTLDYIGVGDYAYILERGEIVEGDHATIGINVELKVKGEIGNPSKKKADCKKFGVFGSQMEERENTKIYIV